MQLALFPEAFQLLPLWGCVQLFGVMWEKSQQQSAILDKQPGTEQSRWPCVGWASAHQAMGGVRQLLWVLIKGPGTSGTSNSSSMPGIS